jgi:hypothetical protein
MAFDQWCIVELFGHTKIAGKVSEAQIGGQTFIRIDVPKTTRQPAFTRLYGQNSIYSITPVEEIVAKGMAEAFLMEPIEVWRLPQMLPARSTEDDLDPEELFSEEDEEDERFFEEEDEPEPPETDDLEV